MKRTGDFAMASHHDFDSVRLHQARFRLLGSHEHARRRSIVLGPAILVRPVGVRGPWTLSVSEEGPLEPVFPRCPERLSRTIVSLARDGLQHRMATAIAVPGDFQRRRVPMDGRLLHGRTTVSRTIYGWALAYRFPDSTGPALVDPHDEVPDLPAFYDSATELLDRVGYLEARGIETRPIALLVHDRDFVCDGRGGRINRYFPTLVDPRPASPD
jgi:hypothetical protein